MCDKCEDTGWAECEICRGTGEGRVDGTACSWCRGRGEVKCECQKENFEEPEDICR